MHALLDTFVACVKVRLLAHMIPRATVHSANTAEPLRTAPALIIALSSDSTPVHAGVQLPLW